jgi:hypothetical protein
MKRRSILAAIAGCFAALAAPVFAKPLSSADVVAKSDVTAIWRCEQGNVRYFIAAIDNPGSMIYHELQDGSWLVCRAVERVRLPDGSMWVRFEVEEHVHRVTDAGRKGGGKKPRPPYPYPPSA